VGFLVLGAALGLEAAHAGAGDPCANPANCCVDPDTCVITDKQSLAAFTFDATIPGGVGSLVIGSYVSGGDNTTGVAPALFPATVCGLSNRVLNGLLPADMMAAVDHQWLASYETPTVVDFGIPVNTVLILPSVEHPPFPEGGIEGTVWGSNSPDTASFPQGWQLATLNAIWNQGWEEPPQCEPGDNSDDFVGQYTFPDAGFRYVAHHANFSVTIFEDPSHQTWTELQDRNADVAGWQSENSELDAIAAPACTQGSVSVDAGPDVTARLGETPCLQGTADPGVTQLAWDVDGDNEVDVTGAEGCVPCDTVGTRTATFFGLDGDGCAGTDSAVVTCECPAAPADGCRAPTKAGAGKLSLAAAKGTLSFSWKKGAATTASELGDPTRDTEYRVCLFDETEGTASLVLDAALAPGTGWKATKKGFAYKAPKGSPPPAGFKSLKLKSGAAGKASVALKGKAMTLPTLPLSQGDEVVAQVFQSQGTCFQSRFAAPAGKNDTKKFKDAGE
jgi:hypothetical protein